MIGRALVDTEFKNLLFSNSAEALKGFDLTADEAAVFNKMPHAEFDKLLSDVETRVSKAGIHLGNFEYGGLQKYMSSGGGTTKS